jgi:hypothetical protein
LYCDTTLKTRTLGWVACRVHICTY